MVHLPHQHHLLDSFIKLSHHNHLLLQIHLPVVTERNQFTFTLLLASTHSQWQPSAPPQPASSPPRAPLSAPPISPAPTQQSSPCPSSAKPCPLPNLQSPHRKPLPLKKRINPQKPEQRLFTSTVGHRTRRPRNPRCNHTPSI